MTESERMQIKGALRKCAKENEGKTTYTGYVVISSVCNAAADRIEELEAQNEKMKCCGNCGNERCTSKYRGNSAYHRQADGFACADNEDWKPMQIKEK